jgi:hypothetical protein
MYQNDDVSIFEWWYLLFDHVHDFLLCLRVQTKATRKRRCVNELTQMKTEWIWFSNFQFCICCIILLYCIFIFIFFSSSIRKGPPQNMSKIVIKATWIAPKSLKLTKMSSDQCCKNQIRPAGSTDWTGNRSQHRSGWVLWTTSQENRPEIFKNRFEPSRTGGTGEGFEKPAGSTLVGFYNSK